MKVLIHNLSDETRSDAFLELNNNEEDLWGMLFDPQPQEDHRRITLQFYKKKEAFVELFFTDTEGNVAIREPFASYVHMVPETTPFTEGQREYLNDVKPSSFGKELLRSFLESFAITSLPILYEVFFPKIEQTKIHTWIGKIYFSKLCNQIGRLYNNQPGVFISNPEDLSVPITTKNITLVTTIDDQSTISETSPIKNVFFTLENGIYSITDDASEHSQKGVLVRFNKCKDYLQDMTIRKYVNSKTKSLLVSPDLQYVRVLEKDQKLTGFFFQFFKGFVFEKITPTWFHLPYHQKYSNDFLGCFFKLLGSFHKLKILLGSKESFQNTVDTFINVIKTDTNIGQCNFVDFSTVKFGRFNDSFREKELLNMIHFFGYYEGELITNMMKQQYKDGYTSDFSSDFSFLDKIQLGFLQKKENCNCTLDTFVPDNACDPAVVLDNPKTKKDVNSVKKKCLNKWHPDKNPDRKDTAAEAIELIKNSSTIMLQRLSEGPATQNPNLKQAAANLVFVPTSTSTTEPQNVYLTLSDK